MTIASSRCYSYLMDNHFTPESRQEMLDRVLTALKADERIIGVLIVGSGAVGFDDDLSDIDLCIVCPDDQTLTIYKDWRERFEKLLPVIGCSPVTYSPTSHLYALLLDGFLELDAGFISIGSLTAKKERWKVAFDRSGRIKEIMQRTWAERREPDIRTEYLRRASGIWHVIMHVGQAIMRGHPWKALYYLEIIRTRTIELACLRLGLNAGHYRQADCLSAEFLDALRTTLPTSMDDAELLRAWKASVECFFHEAGLWDKMLGMDLARLEPKMQEYINLISSS